MLAATLSVSASGVVVGLVTAEFVNAECIAEDDN